MKFVALALAAFFLAITGGVLSDDSLPDLLNGKYVGTVQVEAWSGDGSIIVADSGQAEAVFRLTDDGGLMLVVTGSIDQDGDNGLVFQLLPDDNGWSRRGEEQNFAIGTDGRIVGQEWAADRMISWSGTVSPETMALETRIEFTEDAGSGAQSGTAFSFRYMLAATEVDQVEKEIPSANDPAKMDEKCSRVEWRLQAVPNIWGGAMDMISVPHCVP